MKTVSQKLLPSFIFEKILRVLEGKDALAVLAALNPHLNSMLFSIDRMKRYTDKNTIERHVFETKTHAFANLELSKYLYKTYLCYERKDKWDSYTFCSKIQTLLNFSEEKSKSHCENQVIFIKRFFQLCANIELQCDKNKILKAGEQGIKLSSKEKEILEEQEYNTLQAIRGYLKYHLQSEMPIVDLLNPAMSITITDENDNSIAHILLDKGINNHPSSYRVIDKLIKREDNFNSINKRQQTPISLLVKNKNLHDKYTSDILEKLFDKMHIDLKIDENLFNNAFDAEKEHTMKFLFKHDVIPHQNSDEGVVKAYLSLAVEFKSQKSDECFKYHIQSLRDIDFTNEVGLTLLMRAALLNKPELVNLCLEQGADIDKYYEIVGIKYTALSISISYNHTDISKILLQHYLDNADFSLTKYVDFIYGDAEECVKLKYTKLLSKPLENLLSGVKSQIESNIIEAENSDDLSCRTDDVEMGGNVIEDLE
ncbi:ankyrin repeat domain-containing protein [Rickettsiaceae bacterium]|nr:ankyrin repeat domain-containing protein [Rickettsiaceae bacterium]